MCADAAAGGLAGGLAPFQCPTCAQPLLPALPTATGGALLQCAEGHTVALARRGDVHLAPAGRVARKSGVRW